MPDKISIPHHEVESLVNMHETADQCDEDLNNKIGACIENLKQYCDDSDKCQAIVNACYLVAKTDDFCQNNPPLNDGWGLGNFVAEKLGISMTALVARAHSREKSKSSSSSAGEERISGGKKVYQAGEILGAEVSGKKNHEVLLPNQHYSIEIYNDLGQVAKGTYNIIWQNGTYVFEHNPALGRVKIMPGDRIRSYQQDKSIFSSEAPKTKLSHRSIPNWVPNFLREWIGGKRRLESAEILKMAKAGDIVFQTSLSSQSKAIELATESNITHMGLLINHEGQLQVLEAVQPVKTTPFEVWKDSGKDRLIGIKRASGNVDLEKVISEAKSKLGKPYDVFFQWNDASIYCSELVYDAFKAQGLEIGKPTKLKYLDFSSDEVQQLFMKRLGISFNKIQKEMLSDLLKKYKTIAVLMESPDWDKIKNKVPARLIEFFEQPIITPASMFQADNLEDVYNEF